MTQQADLARFIHLFQTVSMENVGKLADLYTTDAFFKDPLNEVSGRAAILGIFVHMFKQVNDPKFVVTRKMLQDDTAFIVWDFHFLKKGEQTEQCIHGSSHIKFGLERKVKYHRDYWDAAEELYEKVPILGIMMRFLKNQARNLK